MEKVMLRLEQIEIKEMQVRDDIDYDVVEEYQEYYKEKVPMPPIEVFHDGVNYFLADGFHRFHAAKRAGLVEIEANVHTGDPRAALLFAVGCNDSHGHRRTNDDKRKCVKILLNDKEWGQWSDRQIARQCKVSDKTVASVREDLSAEIRRCAQPETRTVQRNGSTYEMRRKGSAATSTPSTPDKPHKETKREREAREKREAKTRAEEERKAKAKADFEAAVPIVMAYLEKANHTQEDTDALMNELGAGRIDFRLAKFTEPLRTIFCEMLRRAAQDDPLYLIEGTYYGPKTPWLNVQQCFSGILDQLLNFGIWDDQENDDDDADVQPEPEPQEADNH